MTVPGRSLLTAAIVFAMALVGATLMIIVDSGGTVWLKFALYAIFFGAVFLAAVLSPIQGCGLPFFRRQTKG
jgi:hypothetical protein